MNEKVIKFGLYPQSIKENNVIVNNIKDINGYYLGSDGNKYAMFQTKMIYDNVTFINGEGVNSNSIYYFKVEPIYWQILKETSKYYILFCNNIIDTCIYDMYTNNYEESYIREWLNNNFYLQAFNDEERKQIRRIIVDNSLESTNDTINAYVSSNTSDKVFLLSTNEIFSSDYGFVNKTRKKLLSDYAIAKLAYLEKGYGKYWLRSPENRDNTDVCSINSDGKLRCDCVSNYDVGVACCICLFKK